MKCKICSRNFKNTHSLSAHLRQTHKIRLSDYLEQYNENHKICKSVKQVKCIMCSKIFNGFRGLGMHLQRSHDLSSKKYYDIFLKNINEGICIECGSDTSFLDLNQGYRLYCSTKCMANSEKIENKKKKTCLIKYGVDSQNKCPEINEKRKNTFLKRFGSTCYFNSGKHIEYMLNGGSSHCRSFIQCLSKPQVELFEIVKLLYPGAKLEFPCFNYSIDIAIIDKMIAIEYDGSYWHQDKDADLKRQKNIEDQGWSFLRYTDLVPTREELQKDIKNLIQTRA